MTKPAPFETRKGNIGVLILLALLLVYALTNKYWLPDWAAEYIRGLVR